VLVHGAWQTASTWDLVVPKLRAAGYEVTVPLLTGLERERHSPLTPAIGLQTHIDDVLGFLTRQNLHDVILVGHRDAGMIIPGVAEHALYRLQSLVYIDALVPRDRQSAIDLVPETISSLFRRHAENSGGGWRLPCGEGQLDMWGLKPGPARDFVRSHLSDFTIRCFEEAIDLPTNAAAKIPRTYISCTAEGYPARAVFQRFAERARRERWHCHELASGHVCHAETPDTLVSTLLTVEPKYVTAVS
jgi:pimeloyl-ACP methyl ester carboxylesterase